VIADDYEQDFPPAVDENPYLSINTARQTGKDSCQFGGYYLSRRDFPFIKSLDVPYITCLQTYDITMNLVYGSSPFLRGFYHKARIEDRGDLDTCLLCP